MFVLGSSISVQMGEKTFGLTNKWGVQLNIGGIEKKIKNEQVGGGGTFIWYLRVHILYIFQ